MNILEKKKYPSYCKMYYGTKKCKNKTLSIQRVYSTLSDDSFKDDSSEKNSGAVQ